MANIVHQLNSQVGSKAVYDPGTGVMTVHFHDGRRGQYSGISPELAQEWLNSPSFGSFLYHRIRVRADLFPYAQVKEEASQEIK